MRSKSISRTSQARISFDESARANPTIAKATTNETTIKLNLLAKTLSPGVSLRQSQFNRGDAYVHHISASVSPAPARAEANRARPLNR